jgi:hypothetical protein
MRLYVVLDEDTVRALRSRAIDERRSLRDQCSWELEKALADVYRPEATPSDLTHTSEAPGSPWQAPGAPRKGK